MLVEDRSQRTHAPPALACVGEQGRQEYVPVGQVPTASVVHREVYARPRHHGTEVEQRASHGRGGDTTTTDRRDEVQVRALVRASPCGPVPDAARDRHLGRARPASVESPQDSGGAMGRDGSWSSGEHLRQNLGLPGDRYAADTKHARGGSDETAAVDAPPEESTRGRESCELVGRDKAVLTGGDGRDLSVCVVHAIPPRARPTALGGSRAKRRRRPTGPFLGAHLAGIQPDVPQEEGVTPSGPPRPGPGGSPGTPGRARRGRPRPGTQPRRRPAR